MVRLSVHTIEFKLSLSHTHTPCRFSIIIRLLGVITNQALHRRKKKKTCLGAKEGFAHQLFATVSDGMQHYQQKDVWGGEREIKPVCIRADVL